MGHRTGGPDIKWDVGAAPSSRIAILETTCKASDPQSSQMSSLHVSHSYRVMGLPSRKPTSRSIRQANAAHVGHLRKIISICGSGSLCSRTFGMGTSPTYLLIRRLRGLGGFRHVRLNYVNALALSTIGSEGHETSRFARTANRLSSTCGAHTPAPSDPDLAPPSLAS